MRHSIVTGSILAALPLLTADLKAQSNQMRPCRQQAAAATNVAVRDIDARRDQDLGNGNFRILWSVTRGGRQENGFCEVNQNGRVLRFQRAQVGGGGPTPVTPSPGRPPGRVEFTGMIFNNGSQKCLDLDVSTDGGGRDQTNIHQYGCHGSENQRWELINLGNREYAIRSIASGKVLDVEGMSKDNGANIYQFSWHGGGNQRWRAEGGGNNFQLTNVNSGKCLDVRQGSKADGANIVQFNCHGRPNQRWRVGYRK